jgi:hypothetical protein
MIRLRGVPIGDEDARELARRLREHALVAVGIAERVERALVAEGGLIATNPPEARAVLTVVDQWLIEAELSEGLREARASIAEMLSAA